MSFRAFINLVFAHLALTIIQVVLAFNGLTILDTHLALYGTVLGISIAKLAMTVVVSIRPPTAPAHNICLILLVVG